jgi:BirA family biotin operon repressor/biotin-[acetyl-CoA-carboxylase] ligase
LPLSEHALRHALERIGVEAPVRFEEVTRSTQATALALAREGTPEWTLVAAGHQTEGRGRLGRAWVDEPGGALMFSLVLRPDLDPRSGGLIPLLAGSAMADSCREVTGLDVGCKWPNDLLVGQEKVGGILAESEIDAGRFAFVVLGVGVNLSSAPSGVPGAGALGDVAPQDLLGRFLELFTRRYEPAHPAFAGAVTAAYREVCVTLGRRVRATGTNGIVVEGEAIDVDETGALVVRTATGLEPVHSGEIEHLRSR